MDNIIGRRVLRVDAPDKAAGVAKYTDDLCPPEALEAMVLHSTIANGLVRSIDTSAAQQVPGVVKIVTCFDVPERPFATAGHPWSVEPAHQDIADRRLLNQRVRYIGDDVAAVVAVDTVAAARALRLIRVEYEEYPAYADWQAAITPEAQPLHPEVCDSNIVRQHGYSHGDWATALAEPGLVHAEGRYQTQGVSHCHIEPATSLAWMENDRLVVVAATQIPHILRRVIGQALGLPWGRVRVIKPYLGGGFGNHQDVLYEPLNAFLSQQVGGRCVRLSLSREEVFASTRRRHPITFDVAGWARADGTLVAHEMTAWSEQGAYASHAHSIVANATTYARDVYMDAVATKTQAYTIYCNTTTGGAMRGYGIPQADYALECLMDDLALQLHLDPIDFRLKNLVYEGFADPLTGITCHSNGLPECVEKGRRYIHWDEKRRLYAQQSGPVRRGVGMALFIYKSNVYPISLETASARMVLNQDGSMQLHLGATEIGQGGDTVFSQMAAAATGIDFERIHIISTQDTDIAPFDTGAYGSRQTFVTGRAIKQTGQLFRQKILDYAALLSGKEAAALTIDGDKVTELDGSRVLSLAEVAENAFYSLSDSRHLTAESTHHCTDNTFAMGCCFAEIEVDIPLGRVKIVDMINVHDSGVLINPALAEAQVHGGMSMGLGAALSERMLYDRAGGLRNGNLLDYKLPTAADTPELHTDFVQSQDPVGPFGNKALGEPPVIPVPPAVRNALLHATGVAVNELPMHPELLLRRFREAGLLDESER